MLALEGRRCKRERLEFLELLDACSYVLLIRAHDYSMRPTIRIDDHAMMNATRATSRSAKKATVETDLQTVATIAEQKAALDELRGLGWEGDLGAMRNDWSPEADWALKEKK